MVWSFEPAASLPHPLNPSHRLNIHTNTHTNNLIALITEFASKLGRNSPSVLLVVDDLVLCTVLFSFILTSHSRSCFYPLLHPRGGGCPDLLSLLFHPPLRTISRFARCCLDQIWQNREGGEVKRKVQELRRVQEGCRSFEIRKMKSLRNGEYSATVMWRVKGTFSLLFPPSIPHSAFYWSGKHGRERA